MGTNRRASWLGVLVAFAVLLAGCSDARSGDGLPTLNVFAPTEAAAGGLVPAVGTVGPLGPPYFRRFLCDTFKIGVRSDCWAFIDEGHWAKPGIRVSVDFAQFGPPYRDDWIMAPCGVCDHVFETDIRIREPFEPGQYQVRFWIRDGDRRVGRSTTTTTVNVIR